MKKPGLLLLLGLFFGCWKSDIFTKEERKIIGNSPKAGIMRLYVVNNKEDSLFLGKSALPLTEKCVKSRYFKTLKARMIATVTNPENEGVGIAAPQVGISRMLIAVKRFDKPGEPLEFYINPRIENYSVSCRESEEGCLSVPGRLGVVMRSDNVIIVYNDPDTFAEVTEHIEGFTAVIFQHEIDHLNGRLFIDYIDPVNI